MALKKSLTDPLNWLLLLLAAAFIYYIIAVPYFTESYLKTPQEMTLTEYLSNPAHPRPFILHALSAPPASIEVVVTDLTVAHVDQDSILLVDPSVPAGNSAAPAPAAAPAQDDGQDSEATTSLTFVPEGTAPNNEIMIAGDNVDLLGVSEGQTVSLQVHALHQSPLGWVPQELTLQQDQEEFFNKDELDELEFMKIRAGDEVIRVPYVEVGELRFASGSHATGEQFTLDQLSNDTAYIQAANRLAGATADIHNVRIVERTMEDRTPLFIVEDPEGRRAKVYYNSRLLSEWYWALDRLGDQNVVIRGTLRRFAPGQLRDLEADGNYQAVLDGYEVLSQDGSIVISLENPAGGLLPGAQ